MARTRHRLSKHFVIEEFDCNNGVRCKPREYAGCRYLARQYLEPMRRKFGPCAVHSGYRTTEYNKQVGGEPNSFHIYPRGDGNDQAVDVSFAKGTPTQWAAMASSIRSRKRGGRGGLGVYPTKGFIHIDIRDYQANWRG